MTGLRPSSGSSSGVPAHAVAAIAVQVEHSTALNPAPVSAPDAVADALERRGPRLWMMFGAGVQVACAASPCHATSLGTSRRCRRSGSVPAASAPGRAVPRTTRRPRRAQTPPATASPPLDSFELDALGRGGVGFVTHGSQPSVRGPGAHGPARLRFARLASGPRQARMMRCSKPGIPHAQSPRPPREPVAYARRPSRVAPGARHCQSAGTRRRWKRASSGACRRWRPRR